MLYVLYGDSVRGVIILENGGGSRRRIEVEFEPDCEQFYLRREGGKMKRVVETRTMKEWRDPIGPRTTATLIEMRLPSFIRVQRFYITGRETIRGTNKVRIPVIATTATRESFSLLSNPTMRSSLSQLREIEYRQFNKLAILVRDVVRCISPNERALF